VSVGIKHYKQWTVNPLKGQTGQFKGGNNILCCVAVKDSQVYVGAGDGCLQIWQGKSLVKSHPLHEKKPLLSMWIG